MLLIGWRRRSRTLIAAAPLSSKRRLTAPLFLSTAPLHRANWLRSAASDNLGSGGKYGSSPFATNQRGDRLSPRRPRTANADSTGDYSWENLSTSPPRMGTSFQRTA